MSNNGKFTKPIYLRAEDYKKGVQQDLAFTINTVHDEINYGVDYFLLKPLLKKIINKMTAKKVIDKFGFPYINFLFDSEYNPNSGAFSGEGYYGVDGFSPYEYPATREASIAKKDFHKVLKKLEDKTTTPKPTTKKLRGKREVLGSRDTFKKLKIPLESLVKYTTKSKLGYTLILVEAGEELTYDKKIKKSLASKIRALYPQK